MGSIVDPSVLWLELGLSGSIAEEERAVIEQCIAKSEGAVKHFLRYDPVLRRRTEYYPRSDLNLGQVESVWEVSATQSYLRQESSGQSSELQLMHIPIRSVPAMEVRIDYDGRAGVRAGSFGVETIRTEGEDYWANFDLEDSEGTKLCLDGILRSQGLWPSSARTVRVEYTAGYTGAEFHGEHAEDIDVVLDASPILTAVVEDAKRRVEQIMVRKKSRTGWAAGPKSSESLGDYSYSIDGSLAGKLYGNSMELTDETKMLLMPFVNMGIDQ